MYRSKIAILVTAFLLTACSEGLEKFTSTVVDPFIEGGVQVDIPPEAGEPGAGQIPANQEDGTAEYGVPGQITYSLNLLGVFPDIADYIRNSMDEAVALYNDQGNFKKHILVTYDTEVPYIQAGYDGTIKFGGLRGTRAALHAVSHTLGIGTTSEFYSLTSAGKWTGAKANALIADFDGISAEISIDEEVGHLTRSYGLNNDGLEDNATIWERHVKLVEAMRCDMAIGPCYGFEGTDLKIVNRASGLVLNISENANGGNVFVADDTGSPGQTWTVANEGSGELSFRNAEPDGRAIDTWNGGTVNGTDLKLYGFYGGDSQLYTALEIEAGYYSISPKIAPGQCMDAFGTTDGRNVGTWGCHGGENQQWSFVSTAAQ